MASLYVLDVPENLPVVEVAASDRRVTVRRAGPYFEISGTDAIEIDRRSTGCRHAVWYSCVAGLWGFRIAGWDKNSLRLEIRP